MSFISQKVSLGKIFLSVNYEDKAHGRFNEPSSVKAKQYVFLSLERKGLWQPEDSKDSCT